MYLATDDKYVLFLILRVIYVYIYIFLLILINNVPLKVTQQKSTARQFVIQHKSTSQSKHLNIHTSLQIECIHYAQTLQITQTLKYHILYKT